MQQLTGLVFKFYLASKGKDTSESSKVEGGTLLRFQQLNQLVKKRYRTAVITDFYQLSVENSAVG